MQSTLPVGAKFQKRFPVSLETMLKTNMIVGQRTRRWHPKMQPFIYARREANHLINPLRLNLALSRGADLLFNKARAGQRVLFLGTNLFGKKWLRKTAKRCGAFYCDKKWLGGLLTNSEALDRSLKTLVRLERERRNGTWLNLPKKELSRSLKHKRKLQKTLGGLKYLPSRRMPFKKQHFTPEHQLKRVLPGVAIAIGTSNESKGLLECRQLGIETLSFVDTNDDPSLSKYVIPLNYRSFGALQEAMEILVDAVQHGRDVYRTNAYLRQQALKNRSQRQSRRGRGRGRGRRGGRGGRGGGGRSGRAGGRGQEPSLHQGG